MLPEKKKSKTEGQGILSPSPRPPNPQIKMGSRLWGDQGRLKIIMYQTVIYFKDDLSEEMLEALRVLCDQAFDNRGGKASLSENSLPPFCLIYEGEEELFGNNILNF
jgi:hypothetical protein